MAEKLGFAFKSQGRLDQQFAPWVMLHVQSNPLPIADLHPAARTD